MRGDEKKCEESDWRGSRESKGGNGSGSSSRVVTGVAEGVWQMEEQM